MPRMGSPQHRQEWVRGLSLRYAPHRRVPVSFIVSAVRQGEAPLTRRTCVPTSTCTITAAGRLATCVYPCAALSAAISFGQVITSNRPSHPACCSGEVPTREASASSSPGWSEPQLANTWVMPASTRAERKTVDAVGILSGQWSSGKLLGGSGWCPRASDCGTIETTSLWPPVGTQQLHRMTRLEMRHRVARRLCEPNVGRTFASHKKW